MATPAPYLTIRDAASGLRSGDFSVTELTAACLERIDRVDGRLHSFITVDGDRALDAARRAEVELQAGRDRGPLHGIPVAFKDLFATRGVRTTCHSRSLHDWTPGFDAAVVRRLARAGAIMLGKLGMHEFAFGGPTTDAPFPAVRNPWNHEYAPGGSSSGAGAAVAAGLCYAAVGSDTGGSVRTPSSHCSVVGLKPTRGRVSRYGQVPLSLSLDEAGPMARTVDDCAMMLHAMAGFDRRDPASVRRPVPDYSRGLPADVRGIRVGIPRSGWFDQGLGLEPEVEMVFGEAIRTLERLGAGVVELDGRPFSLASKANRAILLAEAYAVHEKTLREAPEMLGEAFRRRVLPGAFVTAAEYLKAKRAGALLADAITGSFSRVDLLVTPAAPSFPERFGISSKDARPSLTGPFNLIGLPALSVPSGFSRNGLPLGMQLVAPPFQEGLAFRVASAYEQATQWHDVHPAL